MSMVMEEEFKRCELSIQTKNESNLLDIQYGLKLGLKGETWQIWGKNGCFDLRDTSDFYRTVTLLERPYSEMESALKGYVESLNSTYHFPIWRVVGAGLAFQSEQWASLALTWFPHLEKNEKTMLGGLLTDVGDSRWASQKTRQLAKRYAKQVSALG